MKKQLLILPISLLMLSLTSCESNNTTNNNVEEPIPSNVDYDETVFSVTNTAKACTTIVNNSPFLKEGVTFSDVSINPSTGEIFRYNGMYNSFTCVSSKQSQTYDNLVDESKLAFNEVNKIYYAASWETTFTAASSITDTTNIYFDTTSTISIQETGSSVLSTKRGIRVAFVNEDTLDYVVWSPFQQKDPLLPSPQGNGQKSGYITSTNGSMGYYDDAHLMYLNDNSTPFIESGSKGSSSRKDCLGQFTSSKNEF